MNAHLSSRYDKLTAMNNAAIKNARQTAADREAARVKAKLAEMEATYQAARIAAGS